MAYNRRNYLKKVKEIQDFANSLYEPGRQDRNWTWVWRHHVYDKYHICYKQFLLIMKTKTTDGMPKTKKKGLFDEWL